MRRDDQHIEPLFAALGHGPGERPDGPGDGSDPARPRSRARVLLLVLLVAVLLWIGWRIL